MKNFLILLLASVIIGIAAFALFHWIFRFSFSEALNLGITSALASMVGELIKPYLQKRFPAKNKS